MSDSKPQAQTTVAGPAGYAPPQTEETETQNGWGTPQADVSSTQQTGGSAASVQAGPGVQQQGSAPYGPWPYAFYSHAGGPVGYGPAAAPGCHVPAHATFHQQYGPYAPHLPFGPGGFMAGQNFWPTPPVAPCPTFAGFAPQGSGMPAKPEQAQHPLYGNQIPVPYCESLAGHFPGYSMPFGYGTVNQKPEWQAPAPGFVPPPESPKASEAVQQPINAPWIGQGYGQSYQQPNPYSPQPGTTDGCHGTGHTNAFPGAFPGAHLFGNAFEGIPGLGPEAFGAGAEASGNNYQTNPEYGQSQDYFMGLCSDLMEGKTDPAKFFGLLSGTGNLFWKGAIVGALLTVAMNNSSIKSALNESLSAIFGAVAPKTEPQK